MDFFLLYYNEPKAVRNGIIYIYININWSKLLYFFRNIQRTKKAILK